MTPTHHPAPAVTTATATAIAATATPRRGPTQRDTAAGARRQAAPRCRRRHLVSDGGPLVFGRMDRAGGRVGGMQ
ncbi:hypothetical protein EV644_102601 [Kribbella orskensis]|uniref:Uncharacterized protein n=1 Tax=Kribbella orskensis TaxID=2512216 RepID=A0ABY2BSK2_9ACTN|nr:MULTISPECIES: hypothetical protein [Kribbella]TCN42764.1 hypothetical protein EV642_102136 [Kribbella sp. VKM Ac-2500]TCO29880.1 hypothetical protein EV644_102601 [Kribbella orskensis]